MRLSAHYYGYHRNSEFIIFSQRILERVFLESLINTCMSVFFSGFMGNESERGTNKLPENLFAVCLSSADSFSSRTQKKNTHSVRIQFIVEKRQCSLQNCLYKSIRIVK